MNRVPLLSRPQEQSSVMNLRVLPHDGQLFEVRLQRIDGSPFAGLFFAGSPIGRPLLPFPDEVPSEHSIQAVAEGYIAVAKWLLDTGRWPDAEARIQNAARPEAA